MTSNSSMSHCNCCGLIVNNTSENCIRCHYPIHPTREIHFLTNAIVDLQRVSMYGGSFMTVNQLIQRYQQRRQFIQQQSQTPTELQSIHPSTPMPSRASSTRTYISTPIAAAVPEATASSPSSITTPEQPLPVVPNRPVFSFRTFFADQTINIVASLGAFLLLVGALSFVANTNDLFLSLLITFAIHFFFGISGHIMHRFSNLRLIANIYTTIFALLLPLLGFSLYRFALAQEIPFSPAQLLTFTALYATVIYAVLAIYQRFVAFAYLSATSLLVFDIAIANTLSLPFFWLPTMLIGLAIILRLVISTPIFTQWPILRQPALVLIYVCVGLNLLLFLPLISFSLNLDLLVHEPRIDLRWAILSASVLLLIWNILAAWIHRPGRLGEFLPYQLLFTCLLLGYALQYQSSGFALIFFILTCFYFLFAILLSKHILSFGKLAGHAITLALVLIACQPWLLNWNNPLVIQVVMRIIKPQISSFWQPETTLSVCYLLANIVLTLGCLWHAIRSRLARSLSLHAWPWLLFLAGYLLTALVTQIMLALNGIPGWWYLGLTISCGLVLCFVGIKRAKSWYPPLELLCILLSLCTLGASIWISIETTIALLLGFGGAFYVWAIWQKRRGFLFLFSIYTFLATIALIRLPNTFLIVSILLPICTAMLQRQKTRWHLATIEILPMLGLSILTSLLFGILELTGKLYTGQAIAMDIALLTLVWYASILIAQTKIWLFMPIFLGLMAVSAPDNSFWIYFWIAFPLLFIAPAIRQFSQTAWSAWPSYLISLYALILLMVKANPTEMNLATWSLLGYALILYIISLAEKESLLRWLVPVIVILSLIYTEKLGDFYRLPTTVLVCTGLALAGGWLYHKLAYFRERPDTHLIYTLPLYATALGGVYLTGIGYQINPLQIPFVGAIPTALFIFALVAYLVSLIERQVIGLIFVAVFGIGGAFLAKNTPDGYIATIACIAALIGMLARFLHTKNPFPSLKRPATNPSILGYLTWSWPWYTILLTLVIVMQTSTGNHGNNGSNSLFLFAFIVGMITLWERIPLFFLLAAELAVNAILQLPLPVGSIVLLNSALWILIFAGQSIWKILPLPSSRTWQKDVQVLFALLGQTWLIFWSILQGSLRVDTDFYLGHASIGALAILGILCFIHGSLQKKTEWKPFWFYGAGFLCSLIVPWEMILFHQDRFDLLVIAPATFLIVISAFMMNNTRLPGHKVLAQSCALLGSGLLLVPSLWLSFQDGEILPTLLLAGEASGLFLLGIITRLRIHILSGAALIIVSAIHLIFLPTLAIPPYIALSLVGILLLALATGLSLARRTVQAAWRSWE